MIFRKWRKLFRKVDPSNLDVTKNPSSRYELEIILMGKRSTVFVGEFGSILFCWAGVGPKTNSGLFSATSKRLSCSAAVIWVNRCWGKVSVSLSCKKKWASNARSQKNLIEKLTWSVSKSDTFSLHFKSNSASSELACWSRRESEKHWLVCWSIELLELSRNPYNKIHFQKCGFKNIPGWGFSSFFGAPSPFWMSFKMGFFHKVGQFVILLLSFWT